MESVESALLPKIQCPRFTAVEQRAEYIGLVHLHLGADGQHGIIARRAIAVAALPIRVFSSASRGKLLWNQGK